MVAVASFVPGPDVAVILRSATHGARPGLAAAGGAQLGLCVHMLLAVVGLSVVLARHPEALTTIRVLGGAYLLYLGGRLILPTLGRRPAASASRSRLRSARAIPSRPSNTSRRSGGGWSASASQPSAAATVRGSTTGGTRDCAPLFAIPPRRRSHTGRMSAKAAPP